MKVGKRIFLLLLALLMAMPGGQAATVLEVGSSGENVRKVQQRLIQYDYLDGEADGKYGEKTRDAVILFQRRNGLTVDGRVGPDTAAALGVTLSSSGSSSEARGESYKGQVAVAAVVLNRVESASFPNTISGVIYQSGAFSCVSNGSINNTPDSTAIRAALDALNGWDPTGGCLYYYNPRKTDDEWIRTRTVKTVIGNHYFAV